MARLPRLYVPGCSHHIIQRGNNRDVCFFDEKDYAFYLQQLIENLGRAIWRCDSCVCIDDESCAFTGDTFYCECMCKNDAIAR